MTYSRKNTGILTVPFVDLQTQFRALEDEIMPRVRRVMAEGSFILGPEVHEFERNFAEFCGTSDCVGVASGCDALLLAIRACGLGPGDEIITATNTYIATVLAITAAGATPVLVDCLPDSYEIDPEAIRRAVTTRTKAVIPVHLYGQAADMDATMALAREYDLYVIEDAAQAHGATYKGKTCGSIGHAGCFSFYPGKNLGAYGDGGAVVSNDPALVERIRMYGNYGQKEKHHHEVAGWNSRLDSVQAAVLNVKLEHLRDWNEARRRHADRYRAGLAGLPLTLPVEVADREHVYHVFALQCENRESLLMKLKEREIFCGIHYPVPCHLQDAYTALGYKPGDLPIAEAAADRLLSLPMFPELTDEQIEYVCEEITECL